MKSNYCLKILVLTDFFFPDSMGGANKMAFYLSQGFVKMGHKVALITRRAKPELQDRDIIAGIEVYRYDLPRKTFICFNHTARPQIRDILHDLEKEEFCPLDLLLFHQPLVAIEAVTHAFIREAPWIYNFHSSWGEEFLINRSVKWLGKWYPTVFVRKKMRDWIEGKVLRRCQKIIILSRFMQERLKKIHGLIEKSVIIPGGVDAGVFSPPDDQACIRKKLGLPSDKIILFTVRNLRQRMGLINLIRAMADLEEMKDRVHLVIAGEGVLAEKLKKIAGRLKVSEQITFTGYVSEDALPKYYQAADFFVLPTEHLEGFGMVTLESLASGVPVIATPVGATSEILNPIGNEWLCENASEKALAAKIVDRMRWFVQNPDEYGKVRMRCRDLAVREYAWPGIMERWGAQCEEVIRAWKERG